MLTEEQAREIAEGILQPFRFEVRFTRRPPDKTPMEWDAIRDKSNSTLNLICHQVAAALLDAVYPGQEQ